MDEQIFEDGLCNFCVRGFSFDITPTEHTDYKYRDGHKINLDEQNDKVILDITRKAPDAYAWRILYRKEIFYCPFCGTKLSDLKSIRREIHKRYAKTTS